MPVNPFMVTPQADITQGLAGLSSVLKSNREAQEQKQVNEAAQAEIQEAMQSNDPLKLAKLSVKYPQLRESIEGVSGIVSEQQKGEATQFMTEVLSNPDNASQAFMRRIQELEDQGRDPSNTLESLQDYLENPEAELDQMRMMFAGSDPDAFKAFDRQTKVVGDFLVDATSGEVVFDSGKKGPKATEKDINGRLRFVESGDPVFPQVEEVAKGLEGKDRLQAAEGFRNEIAKENTEFQKIANSWDRIAASAQEPSAAGDLALIFNFMKMLDPGSTVREGEFATAANSAGIATRIRGAYNRVVSGERLPEVQRADFFQQAQNIFDASGERASNLTEEFVRIAEDAGLTREEVVVSRGADPDISGRRALSPEEEAELAALEAEFAQ